MRVAEEVAAPANWAADAISSSKIETFLLSVGAGYSFFVVHFREDQLSEVSIFRASTQARKQVSMPARGLIRQTRRGSAVQSRGACQIMGQPRSRKKPTDTDVYKGIMTRINAEGWRELRILAAERDTTLNALAIEALNDLLKKYGRRPLIENPLID